MVGVVRAGFPHRRGGGELVDHRLPRAKLVEAEAPVDGDQTRLVRQQPAHRNVFLAVGRELRPVLRDRRVDVEVATLREHRREDRGHPLRRREAQDDGVLLPRATGLSVGDAAPQVDHRLAVLVHGHRRAVFLTLVEVGAERVRHLLPPCLDRSVDRGHALTLFPFEDCEIPRRVLAVPPLVVEDTRKPYSRATLLSGSQSGPPTRAVRSASVAVDR